QTFREIFGLPHLGLGRHALRDVPPDPDEADDGAVLVAEWNLHGVEIPDSLVEVGRLRVDTNRLPGEGGQVVLLETPYAFFRVPLDQVDAPAIFDVALSIQVFRRLPDRPRVCAVAEDCAQRRVLDEDQVRTGLDNALHDECGS